MAINIGTNFAYHGKLPNFDRDKFKTKAAMMAFDENSIDEGHLSYCEEDGNIYQYKHTNTVDTTTGKWRLFKTEADAALNGTSTNAIQNKAVFDALKLKADAAALAAYQPKYNADYIATKDFNYSELPNGAEVIDLNGYTMTVSVDNTIVRNEYHNGSIDINSNQVELTGVFYNVHVYFNTDFEYCKINSSTFEGCTVSNISIDDYDGDSSFRNCFINSCVIKNIGRVSFSNLQGCTFATSIGDYAEIENSIIDDVIYNRAVVKDGKPTEAGYESNIASPSVSGNAPSCEAVKDALQLKADKTQLNDLATKAELNSKADASELDNYTTTATTNAISADVTSLMNEVFVLTATASVSPNIAEAGTSKAVNVSVDANLGKGRTQVDEITINGTKYTGEIPYTHSATATTTTTYNVTVKKGSQTASKSVAITFVNPSYDGAVAANFTATEANIKALTETLRSEKGGIRTFNLNNQKACIAYPKAFGAATSIKDANGFDYLASYTRSELNVNGELYYVYLLTNAATITDFKQTIS